MARTLKILSLDGGGVRGISSLQILQELMEKIKETQGLDEIPRPCDIFDLIGGTSTGGIMAIMLGRLGMTVDDCIKTYRVIAQRAFTPKLRFPFPGPPRGAYSAKALEKVIKEVVKTQCKSSGCPDEQTCCHENLAFRDNTCVKTIVLAMTKENADAVPTLFKTFDSSSIFKSCTIWEVARATSAATTFFKSIKCGRDQIEFIDAAFGFNNPCEVLIREARNQFPEFSIRQFRVISIGTGLGDVVTIQDTRTSILRALKAITTTSKKVADRLDAEYGDTNQYYRFNVDRGLEDVTLADWKKTSKISAHTHNYLQERQRYIMSCVRNLYLVDGETDNVTNGERFALPPESILEHDRGSPNQLTIHRNVASHNAEQRNSIYLLGLCRKAGISENTSTDGSKQWNSIR
ncbi:FabD/lysophospholipase-like protein [Biscogniauxia marginata]|nr:FabD/lysophospholipase-like protein [Biscogniauxia marginata]